MTDLAQPELRALSLFSLHRATGRFFIAFAAGAATEACLRWTSLEWPVRVIAGWDAASLVLLALGWNIILRTSAPETARRAGQDDPGRHMVFFIALGASSTSLFAAMFVLSKGQPLLGVEAGTPLMVATVALSWALTHTAYTLRYAHLYYRRDGARGDGADGDLTFPGKEAPSDLDFAYFAFTIGMCFQVSDVVVNTTQMRGHVLFHAVISFIYNTVILALVLNVLFNLKP